MQAPRVKAGAAHAPNAAVRTAAGRRKTGVHSKRWRGRASTESRARSLRRGSIECKTNNPAPKVAIVARPTTGLFSPTAPVVLANTAMDKAGSTTIKNPRAEAPSLFSLLRYERTLIQGQKQASAKRRAPPNATGSSAPPVGNPRLNCNAKKDCNDE